MILGQVCLGGPQFRVHGYDYAPIVFEIKPCLDTCESLRLEDGSDVVLSTCEVCVFTLLRALWLS